MTRPVVGTPEWGDDLNADLDGIEALAQAGLDAATEVAADVAALPATFVSVNDDGDLAVAGEVVLPLPVMGGGGGSTEPDERDALFDAMPYGNLTKLGAVLLPGPDAYDAGLVEGPTFYLHADGRPRMLYVGYTDAGIVSVASICQAVTDDGGMTWTKQGQILQATGNNGDPDSAGLTGPVMVVDGDTEHLFCIGLTSVGYEGGIKRICRYSRPYGSTAPFTRHGAVVSPSGISGRWDKTAIWHPNFVKHNGTWYMFFNASGGDDDRERTGFATASTLAGPWTVDPDPLVADADVPGGILSPSLAIIHGDPFVWRQKDGNWRWDWFRFDFTNDLAYDGFSTASDENFPRGWTERGTVLSPTAGTIDGKYAHKPGLLKRGDQLLHFYTAVSSTGGRLMSLAVSGAAPPVQLNRITVVGNTVQEQMTSLLGQLSGQGLGTAPTTIYAADTFDRADGALGSTSTGALAWTTSGTGFAIASNKMAWTGTSDQHATVNTGRVTDYAVQVAVSTISGSAFPFSIVPKSVDGTVANAIVIYRNQSADQWLLKAGAAVFGATPLTSGDLIAGDVVRVDVRDNGTKYQLYINGVIAATWTGITQFRTGTRQGIQGNGNEAVTADNFSVFRA